MPSSIRRQDPEYDRLFRTFRAGDERALAELLQRTRPWLRAVARRCGARGDEIDEVVQDAWVEACSPAAILPRDVPLLVWMASIVQHRHSYLRRSRDRRHRLHLIDDDLVVTAAAPAAQHDALASARGNEVVALVRAAIDELDPTYREVLRLHLFEGLSPQDVAQQLGLSRVVVRVRLFRGMRRLRRRLPDALALLLLAVLARTGRSQTPIWIGATAAASLAVGLTLAYVDDRAPVGREPVAAAPVVDAAAAAPLAAAIEPAPTAPAARERLDAAPVWSVRVRDAEGRPLAGVGVALVPASGGDPRLLTRRFAYGSDGIATFAAPGDGRFVLHTDRGVGAEGNGGDAPRCFELGVPKGRTVRGRVVDGDGAPIAGASIWLATSGDDPLAGTEVATAQADGTFTLVDLPAGAMLAARAAGRAPIPATPLGDAEPVLVLAAPGGNVRGVVTALDGTPIADALVVVGPGGEGASPRLGPALTPELPPPSTCRTGADGAFAAVGVAPGRLPVVVRAPGFAPVCLDVEVAVGDATPLAVRLGPGAIVRGRVLDRATGAPVVAAVACRSDRTFATSTVMSGADGRFEFAAMPPGVLGVVAATEDGGLTDRAIDAAAGISTIELALDRRVPCRGRLATTDGEMLGGWEVAAPTAATRSVPAGVPIATSAADGTVTVPVDPRAGWQHLLLRPANCPLWFAGNGIARPSADGGFEVRVAPALVPSARLQLRLQVDGGLPAAGAPIWMRTGQNVGVPVGRLDDRGEVEVGPLPAGAYMFFTEAPGPDVPPFDLAPMELAAGDRRRFEFTGYRPGRLEFALHFADGSLPRAPLVMLDGSVRGMHRMRANRAEGSQVLLPGSYTFVATGDDFVVVADPSVEIGPGQTVRFERELRRAARRMISLQNLPAACRGSMLNGHFRDGRSDAELSAFTVPTDAAVLMPLLAILPVGPIHFEATATDGTAVTADFVIDDLTPDYAARELVFTLRQ